MCAAQPARLEAYLAISRTIAGELDFKNVLLRISEVIDSKLIPHDHMDVAVLVPGIETHHQAFEAGLKTDWSNGGLKLTNATSPIRSLLDGTKPFIITGDAWKDQTFHFEGARAGPIYDANLRSRIHVPLMVHGKVQGALSISRHKTNAYDDRDVATSRNIADLIAPYAYALNQGERARISQQEAGTAQGRTESLRQGAQRLNNAMEAERRRLGMELHDQTLGELSSIYRYATRFATSGNRSSAQFAKISDDIANCMSELRGIIENARPGVLELLGLTQAIEAHLERAVAGHKIPIRHQVCDHSGGILDRVNETIRTAVFRIVQEAVTNAVLHSGCTFININLLRDEDTVIVSVENDGKSPKDGWDESLGGVNNIRVRADLISSHVSFDTPRSGGLKLTLEVPFFNALEQDQSQHETSMRPIRRRP